MSMPPTLRIELLGGFRILSSDRPLAIINQQRQQALLAYLLLHRHVHQLRQQIAFCFWPDSSDAQAFTNLRKLFFQLRQALPEADQFLFADTQYLGWRSDSVYTLDVAELEDGLDQLERMDAPPERLLAQVVGLYRGELLPGCYEDWILSWRRMLHERMVKTLEKAVEGLERQRAYTAGLRYAEHLVRLEPLQESAYRHQMQFRAITGDRAGALRIYHSCARILEEELGMPPGEETRALYERLLKVELLPAETTRAQLDGHLPLVGRQAAWNQLQQAWREARHRPHFVMIWGETGLGKTRLIQELMRWAKIQTGTQAYARAYDVEGSLAYAPVTEWLRTESLQAVISELEEVWLGEIARLLPELLTIHRTLASPSPLAESWQRQRFFEALARTVTAAPGPRLLVLDDLQWCDTETLNWLHYLFRTATQTSLLVVGAARTEEVAESQPLMALLRQWRREGQCSEIELAPLSAEETGTLVSYWSDNANPGLAATLYQETEGNPFFVVEMLRAGMAEGRQALQENPPLPATVQAVITTRLAQLSLSARKLVQVAAIIGRVFTVEMLMAIGEASEDTLLQGLDELWQRHIIREQGTGYDFSHDKLRAVAYAENSPIRRRVLHRKVAQALEQVYSQARETVAGQLAVHYESAQLPEQAVHYWVRAAQHAEALDAYVEAAGYYERALALHQAQLTDDLSGRFDLILLRSTMLERRGQYNKLGRDIEALLTLATSLNEPTRLAQAYLRQASYLSVTHQQSRAVQAGEQALSLYRAGTDKLGEIQALRELGFLCWSAQDYGNALHYSREVVQLHRQQSEVTGEASALHNLAEIYRGLGSPQQAIILYEQALQLYWGVQEQRRQLLTLYSLAYAFRQVGQADRALFSYQRAIAQGEQMGDRLLLARIYHAMGILYWELQQADLAVSAMAQAVELSQAIGYLPEGVHSLLALSYIEAQCGRQEAAQRHLHAALVPLNLMEDAAGIQEVNNRLQLLATGQADLPEPPTHMNWIRTHMILAEGKVYCEFESPIAATRIA